MQLNSFCYIKPMVLMTTEMTTWAAASPELNSKSKTGVNASAAHQSSYFCLSKQL